MELKSITLKDASLLHSYYQTCEYGLCEYSVVTKLMWRDTLRPCYAQVAGCLVVCNRYKGKVSFEYPVAKDGGDIDQALDAIGRHCMERGIPLVFSLVPESKIPHLIARHPYLQIRDTRAWQDYIYHRDDLQFFAGRRYSGQRNHINKFRTNWPGAEFQILTVKDMPLIEAFWADFEAEFPKRDDPMAMAELALSKKIFKSLGKPWVVAGAMVDNGKLIALSLAERCGETLIVHIEKALYSYTGVYPTLVQSFVDAFGRECAWVNREDDASQKGLRTSKLQYGPAKLAPKYHMIVETELQHHCTTIPTLTTNRLTLDALTKADIPAYNALVLNAQRNVYWGYDDVAGLGTTVEEDSFFNVAKRDFQAKMAVNFAIRLDGVFIGEVVLYQFDGCGRAELGCRVLPEFAGQGYGAEAFAAVADWGLFSLQLRCVVAKCFKENKGSYRMLSSCMRKKGEDETFYYFEKLV